MKNRVWKLLLELLNIFYMAQPQEQRLKFEMRFFLHSTEAYKLLYCARGKFVSLGGDRSGRRRKRPDRIKSFTLLTLAQYSNRIPTEKKRAKRLSILIVFILSIFHFFFYNITQQQWQQLSEYSATSGLMLKKARTGENDYYHKFILIPRLLLLCILFTYLNLILQRSLH